MPLRAYINGVERISTSFTDIDWTNAKNELKKGKIKIELSCCKQNGFLRISSKGLKHFIHAKRQNSCDWKPESIEHLTAKAEIIKACEESGWEAIPEFTENDWRADVLAKKNNLRIAFEIQWSTQTSETTEQRQKRYLESNVRGCWFFRKIPKQYLSDHEGFAAKKELPLFELKKEQNGNFSVLLNDNSLSLHDFIKSLLSKRIKFCSKYRAKKQQEVDITFYETSCWKCGKLQHLFTLNNQLKSCCDTDIYFMSTMWDDDNLDKHPSIVKAVQDLANKSDKFKIGEVKKRYSKTVQDGYLSFGCYSCDAIFGDFFLFEDKIEAYDSGRIETVKTIIEIEDLLSKGPHWCHSHSQDFCE